MKLRSALESIVVSIAVQHHFSSKSLGAEYLRDRSRLRHHDRCMDLVVLGRKGKTLRVIASR